MMKKLLFFSFLLFSYSSYSQCDDPILMDPAIITHAACPGGGQIQVTNVFPALSGSEYFQYSLFSNTLSSEIYTWQTSNIFPNLQAGSYEIRVRRRCSVSPYSSVGSVNSTVTINNTEIPVTITSVTVLRNARCNDGVVIAAATGGAPLEFALVSSLTETEPIATYVRPRQPTSRFEGLPAGNYFMRVYNGCNNASTIPFTITQNLTDPQLIPLSGYFIPIGCDSVSFSFRAEKYFKNTNFFPADVNVKGWIVWPNGAVDSIVLANQSNSDLLNPRRHDVTKRVHISNMDPGYNPVSVWPSNLPNATYTITYGFRDNCGVIHTTTFTYVKPTGLDLYARAEPTSTLTDCDNVAYRFAIRHSVNGTTTLQGFAAYHGFEYSLNNGTTWTNTSNSNAIPTNTGTAYTPIMAFPRGISQTVMIRYCDTIITTTFTPEATTALNSNLYVDELACLGKGRIRIRNYNANGPVIAVRVLSVPVGQPAIGIFTVPLSTGTYTDPVELSNLLPGIYQLQLLDTIGGATCNGRRTLSIEVKAFNFDFTFNVTCNKNLEIKNVVTYGSKNGFKVKIYDLLSNQVLGGPNGYTVSNITGELNLPGSTFASLPNGTYKIRVYRYLNIPALDNCSFIEKIWVKSSNNNLNLQNSIFVSACSNGFGAMGASASGGSAPYEYTLLDLSNNVIPPTAPGANTFDNLIASQVYKLSVLDACGAVVNRLISSNSQIEIAAPGYSSMPCPGDNIALTLPQFTGVTYAWMKDGVLLPSETSNILNLNNLQLADAGVYQSTITIGGCDISGSLLIDPNNCGGPLSVDLVSFNAYCDVDGTVALQWETASEMNAMDFILQKSADLINWEKVDILPAKGNSSIMTTYATMDRTPYKDITYYQLIQRDFNGSERRYSPISNSCENSIESEIKVYPNPTNGDFNVEVNAEKRTSIEIDILDAKGRIISTQSHHLEIGNNTLFISENLSSGIYLIRIIKDNKEINPIKLVVK